MAFKYNPVIASAVNTTGAGYSVNAPASTILVNAISSNYILGSIFASDFASNRLQVNLVGTGINGNAAVAKAAAITTPNVQTAAYVQADVTSLKTAIDAIRVAIQAIGITA